MVLPTVMKAAISIVVVAGTLLLGGCERGPESALKGQSNVTMTFYGKVVDDSGAPLQGAEFEFRLEAYPADWSFKNRGRPNDAKSVTAASDASGCFQLTLTGCTLRRMKAERAGYQHFCDEDRHGSAINNYWYRFVSFSDLWFKMDADHPAVFVFVKDGVREVSALPCKGGFDSGGGSRWTMNKSGWPKKPSLPDVVYKPPATQPQPTSRSD